MASLGGARDILHLSGLASGAFMHEVATATTTFPVQPCAHACTNANVYEILGRVNTLLPQGFTCG